MKITYIIIGLIFLIGSNVATFFITSTLNQVKLDIANKTIAELNTGRQYDSQYIQKLDTLVKSLQASSDNLFNTLKKATDYTLTMDEAKLFADTYQKSYDEQNLLVTEIVKLAEDRHEVFSKFKYANVTDFNYATSSGFLK